jgi:hypothetical protein
MQAAGLFPTYMKPMYLAPRFGVLMAKAIEIPLLTPPPCQHLFGGIRGKVAGKIQTRYLLGITSSQSKLQVESKSIRNRLEFHPNCKATREAVQVTGDPSHLGWSEPWLWTVKWLWCLAVQQCDGCALKQTFGHVESWSCDILMQTIFIPFCFVYIQNNLEILQLICCVKFM